MSNKSTDLAQLRAAHTAVSDAYGEREDALFTTLRAYFQYLGAEGDETADVALRKLIEALHELILTHENYGRALEAWGPLHDQLQQLPVGHWKANTDTTVH
jgi:hypothetical protein